jgi:hypothetical protein
MDLILISDLTKKLSSIFFYKKKSDIQSFIEDPLSLDLTHLENIIKINKVLVGGANKITDFIGGAVPAAAANPAVPAAPTEDDGGKGGTGAPPNEADGGKGATGAPPNEADGGKGGTGAPPNEADGGDGTNAAAAVPGGAAAPPTDAKAATSGADTDPPADGTTPAADGGAPPTDAPTGDATGDAPTGGAAVVAGGASKGAGGGGGVGGMDMRDVLQNPSIITDRAKKAIDDAKNMMAPIDKDPIENPFYKLLNLLTKLLLYPLLFIFMMIFPYIYVSMKSFKKLTKLYRNNVLSM